MNKNIAISIIVPIYNVEKYLAECLNSCINQTLKNIEIICVNDCTSDNSRSIAENFAKRDSRIKIIDHDQNKKQGAARNTGVNHAAGEYIWFVDSDDFIAENACQLLYDTAKQHDVDILCFDAINVKKNDNSSIYNYEPCAFFIDWYKNKTILMQKKGKKLKGNFTPAAYLYICKREHIKQFTFRENCFWEDTDFTPRLFSECNTLRCIPFTAYFYRLSANSTMRGKITEKKLLDFIKAGDALKKVIKQKHFPAQHSFTRLYDTWMASALFLFLRNAETVENSEECKKALKYLTPIVRCIKRKEFFHNLLTLPLRDKIFIIYWHTKNYFSKCLSRKAKGEK